MQRDIHKSRTYEAEHQAFNETLYTEQFGMFGVASLAAAVADHPWWQANGADFSLRPTRMEANCSSANPGTGMISIAHGMEDAATLTHELTHLFVHAHRPHVAAHGMEFRTAMCDVAEVVLGTAGSDMLTAAFDGWKLPRADRTWAEPSGPLSVLGSATLFRKGEVERPRKRSDT